MPNEMFTRRELSALFKVTAKTIKKWTDEGLIRATYPGGRPRYSIEEVERLSKIQTPNTKANAVTNP